MNDPGLDDPISQTSHALERGKTDDEASSDDGAEEKAFLEPSRWWMASTAFPLLAGTFGPMASAFNICALTVHWRLDIPPGPGANEANAIDISDPQWLLAINGISLAFALIANFALLLNMARRLSFTIAQPITIVGWYIASFLLIADVSGIIHVVKAPGQRRALSQGYYYAIFAAAIYFVIASLMIVTVYGARRGHYSKQFNLTMSQRTLMLQTISYLIYMVGGAGVYARIEGWQFLDAVYFTNYTLLTIGIGNYAPLTHLGRSLLFPYAVIGIVILGLLIGSIRSLGLESGKSKLDDRMTEKRREKLVKHMLRKNKNHHILVPIVSEEHAKDVGMSERERREEEFKLMRKIQNQVSSRQKWVALVISGGAWLFLWLIGALIFYFAEHEQEWTYFVSLYFAYTSLLTIGYGDYAPLSNSGTAFFVLWSLLAVPTLTIVISNMGDTVIKSIRDVTLYLGEVTILPGDQGIRTTLRHTAKNLTRGGFPSGIKEDQPPGMFTSHGADEHQIDDDNNDDDEAHRKNNGIRSATTDREKDRMGKQLSSERHIDIHQSPQSYHHAIAREIRNVMKHRTEQPPRKYSYREWAYFLKLLGEDEDSPNSHRQPPANPKSRQKSIDEDPDHTKSQQGNHKAGKRGKKDKKHKKITKDKTIHEHEESHHKPNDGETSDNGNNHSHNKDVQSQHHHSRAQSRHPGMDSSENSPSQESDHKAHSGWSWLGERSPLMDGSDEADWVLDRLVKKLEMELRAMVN